MLLELHVRDLGVIDDLVLVLEPGMTALTGETGAGKTLVVEAIELLVGARADPVLVRPGADEARVEGRFVDGDRETVLARAVPRTGRSRAYVDGHLATVAELAEQGRSLVDLHGQHAHQSLLAARVQRDALDRFASVDLSPLAGARARRADADAALAALGGDSRARAREIDLLRFQVGELDAARLEDPDEDDRLEEMEDLLAGAESHRKAGAAAYEALMADGGAGDGVGRAVAACAGHAPLADTERRLRAVAAEVADAAADLRATVEAIPIDPDRLEEVRARRRLLGELRRKYGERLSDVLAYASEARSRLSELEGHDQRVAALEAERAQADAAVREAAAAVGRARRSAAPSLAATVEANLRTLAMPRARFEVTVGDEDPGDEVTFLLGANPGEAALPLAKVASGGELARTSLAARLVLTQRGVGAAQAGAPPTLVFDEVDAGVGGEAALAVGRALAELAADHQVLVVTHLPQVAAFADHQVAVDKEERGGRTVARARTLDGQERVVELSRMLSGQPTSTTAQGHAEELLATASRERGR
jgi:DNA repair protein RecN (Recombination protein N)